MTDNKEFAIIVAMAEDRAIGKDKDLMWHLRRDLKRFKKITSGHTVVMGRKTFESFGSRALPNRKNIIITSNRNYKTDDENIVVVHSFEDAIKECEENKLSFIIGGSQVYKWFLPFTDKLYLTIVHNSFPEADTYFPEFSYDEWKLINEERVEADENNDFPYTFKDFVRK